MSELKIVPLTRDNAGIVHSLWQLYAYDLSTLAKKPLQLDLNGLFKEVDAEGYGWQGRSFLFYVGPEPAGFALITDHDGIKSIDEFFLTRMHRGNGLATKAALEIITPGKWRLRVAKPNYNAVRFWASVFTSLPLAQVSAGKRDYGTEYTITVEDRK